MIDYWFERYLRGRPATRILDLGPGYNTFALHAAALTGASEITFMDYADKILDWQIEQGRARGIQAVGLKADLNTLPLPELPATYDLILCQEVLEHLPHAAAVLTHLVARLSPGGSLLITVPTRFSERWIKRLNPSYMRNEPYGHVNEFDRAGLTALLKQAGLVPEVFESIQPHYFLGHLWLFGSRVAIEGASGAILKHDLRTRIFGWIVRGGRWFFRHTGPRFWGRIFPRNYFVIARRAPSP